MANLLKGVATVACIYPMLVELTSIDNTIWMILLKNNQMISRWSPLKFAVLERVRLEYYISKIRYHEISGLVILSSPPQVQVISNRTYRIFPF